MRKAIAPIAIAAALGGAFGAIAFGPSFAGAQDDTTTTVQEETTDAPAAPGGRIQDALSGLVDNGTLTQEQADAVTQALRDALPRGGPGHGRHLIGGFDAAADHLGLSKEALLEALQGDATLADVADAQGKSVDELIGAMVADANAKIDEAVANGRIDEDRAAEMKSNLEERITSLVNDGVKVPRPEGGLRDRIRERLEGAAEDAS
jgi:hypothetical protein